MDNRKEIIRLLRRLEKIWPNNLGLFAASGTLCLLETEDGFFRETPRGGVDSNYVIETFMGINCDGGDW